MILDMLRNITFKLVRFYLYYFRVCNFLFSAFHNDIFKNYHNNNQYVMLYSTVCNMYSLFLTFSFGAQILSATSR